MRICQSWFSCSERALVYIAGVAYTLATSWQSTQDQQHEDTGGRTGTEGQGQGQSTRKGGRARTGGRTGGEMEMDRWENRDRRTRIGIQGQVGGQGRVRGQDEERTKQMSWDRRTYEDMTGDRTST
jgi:hypothetical protein